MLVALLLVELSLLGGRNWIGLDPGAIDDNKLSWSQVVWNMSAICQG